MPSLSLLALLRVCGGLLISALLRTETRKTCGLAFHVFVTSYNDFIEDAHKTYSVNEQIQGIHAFQHNPNIVRLIIS